MRCSFSRDRAFGGSDDSNKELKQKHKRPEKHAQQEGDLGQKKARLEKEKKAQMSAMEQASHGPEPHQKDEGHSD
jgi:hypothetical protein